MKMKKSYSNSLATTLCDEEIRPCIKLQMDNIVFPKWSDLGLLGLIFAQKVKTKEQPLGCDYEEAKFQVVMRVIGGKVLMTGGRPDSYTWKQSKVQDMLAKLDVVPLIGCNCADAVINLANVMQTITDIEERKMFADMFCNLNKDLLLLTSPAEERLCAEVTQSLYDLGLTAIVDSWMVPDENGKAEATQLNVGDFLIFEPDGNVYCIRRAEFLETYSF